MSSQLARLYEKQISLTEWYEAIGDPRAAQLRDEDTHKHERLETLNRIIGLPFGKPVRFTGKQVAERSRKLTNYIQQHGHEECAIRLIPHSPQLPKLRMRGHIITDAVAWFDKQAINPADYDVDFVPHDHPHWATIFIISDKGIYGEIKQGDPSQLTQGIYKDTDQAPTTFSYDFKKWRLSNDLPGGLEQVKQYAKLLHVPQAAKRQQLQKTLNATFAHNYLKGYFETSTSDEYGIWFIDYNRILGDVLTEITTPNAPSDTLVSGRCACPGTASGTVKIINPDQLESATLPKGSILVCSMTTPDYLPLMRQAAAIVTDLGGVLSHAAIIARELKKPCITGASNATQVLKDGQKVTVDAANGIVRLVG